MNYSKEISDFIIRNRFEMKKRKRRRRNLIIAGCIFAAVSLITIMFLTLLVFRNHNKKPSDNFTVSADETSEISVTMEPVYEKNINVTPKTTVSSKKNISQKSHSAVSAVTTAVTTIPETTQVLSPETDPEQSVSSQIPETEPPSQPEQTEYIDEPENISDNDIYSRFPVLNINEQIYTTTSGKLFNETVGEKTADINIDGTDLSVYKVNDISESCAVAVKFNGNDCFFSYTALSYTPTAIGLFLDDLNFDRYSVFHELTDTDSGKAAQSYDVSLLMKLMFERRESVSIANVQSCRIKYRISLTMPYINVSDKYLGITENGYIVTDVLGTPLAFYIGKDFFSPFFRSINFTDQYTGDESQ